MTHSQQKNIKKLFPYLSSKQNQKIIYFDNAATTHKPASVISAISNFYKYHNSNIHRSSHSLGSLATQKYESARAGVCEFISANKIDEIVFTSGATESINMVASSYGLNINKGDIILVSEIEHHSNMLPWKMLADRLGALIKIVPLNNDLKVNIPKLKMLLNSSVKMIAIHHVSNVTGALQDIKSIVKEARPFGVPVFVDGAQAPAHVNIDVRDLGCDFYCFSGHKMFGPTGVGVLFAKEKYLKELPPYKTGGQMVFRASFDRPQWSEAPLKFEAGTPNIAGVIGLHVAIQFIQDYGIEKIIKKEHQLTSYMYSKLTKIPNLILYGGDGRFAPIFPFNIKNIHHYDLSALLSENNILIRSGHLCNQGLMEYLDIQGCLRASLSFYNTFDEIDGFISGLKKVISFLSK